MVGSPLSFCMVRFVEAGSATLLSQVPYIIKTRWHDYIQTGIHFQRGQ